MVFGHPNWPCLSSLCYYIFKLTEWLHMVTKILEMLTRLEFISKLIEWLHMFNIQKCLPDQDSWLYLEMLTRLGIMVTKKSICLRHCETLAVLQFLLFFCYCVLRSMRFSSVGRSHLQWSGLNSRISSCQFNIQTLKATCSCKYYFKVTEEKLPDVKRYCTHIIGQLRRVIFMN